MLRLFDGGACELGDVCPENGDDWPQAALELTLPKAEGGRRKAETWKPWQRFTVFITTWKSPTKKRHFSGYTGQPRQATPIP